VFEIKIKLKKQKKNNNNNNDDDNNNIHQLNGVKQH
jgi:hypothetical protein